MSEENTMSEEDMAVAMEGTSSSEGHAINRQKLERFGDVELTLDAILGTVSMPLEQFLKLGRGAIIELEQTRYDDLILQVNGTTVATGEINVLEETIGVQIKDVAHKNKMYDLDA